MDVLQCPGCGGDVFESDEDGMFWEDMEGMCPTCGMLCTVGVDDGRACVRSSDTYEDRGQPRCTGACSIPSVAAEFIGRPCAWNCEHTKAAKTGMAYEPGVGMVEVSL